MISFALNRSSLEAALGHIDNVKQRVVVGIRLGMRDAMRGLSRQEVEAVSGHQKTGKLARILGQGGRVIETGDFVTGIYRPRSPDLQPHYWLQYGVKIPAVSGTLMQMNIAGATLYRMGHRAFETPRQPFFFTTADQFREQFFRILAERLDQAIQA